MGQLLHEKNRVNLKRIVIRLSIAGSFQLLLYLVQFLLVPVFYFPGPHDNSYILIITTIIIVFLGMFSFNRNLIYWITSIPLYYIFVNLYHPQFIYGIYYRDPIFGYMTSPNILIISMVVLFIEILVWIFVMLLRLILRISRKP